MKRDSGLRIQDSAVAAGFSPALPEGERKREFDPSPRPQGEGVPIGSGRVRAEDNLKSQIRDSENPKSQITNHQSADEDRGDAAPRPLIEEKWRPDVEQLLTAGLAVEDIVEAVMEQGGPEIREGAILAHYRTHPDLQKQRVEKTIVEVGKLRQALGNPEADHGLAELANSALMIGYMGLTKKRSNSITIKDAECIRLSRQNLKLRQRYLKLKEVSVKRENALHWKKLRYEDVKYDTAVAKLKHLRQALRALMTEGKLEASTLEKIREIYGIIRQPFIPDITEETPQAGS